MVICLWNLIGWLVAQGGCHGAGAEQPQPTGGRVHRARLQEQDSPAHSKLKFPDFLLNFR